MLPDGATVLGLTWRALALAFHAYSSCMFVLDTLACSINIISMHTLISQDYSLIRNTDLPIQRKLMSQCFANKRHFPVR